MGRPNNVKKRFIALLVALIMVLQCPAMAFAAEAENGAEAENISNSEQFEEEEDPTEEDPTEENPTEENPSEEDPTEENPSEENPTKENPTEENPTEENPSEKEPSEKEPSEEKSDEEKPIEQDAAKEQDTAKNEKKPDEKKDIVEGFLSEEYIPDADMLPDNDELFAGYFRREMDKSLGYDVSFFGRQAREQLSPFQKVIYDKVRAKIEEIASGELSSTVFTISDDDIDEDSLKISEVIRVEVNDSMDDDEIREAIRNTYSEELNTGKLIDALLADLPYDIYWYDKTDGMGTIYGYIQYDDEVYVTEIEFTFPVSEDYLPTDAESNDCVDTDKTGATYTAVEKAQAVVADFANDEEYDDYDRLVAYKEFICDEVSYNHDAVDSTPLPYGDPWQIIYVFDDDPNTNVVCEGYSKAFQYLCDLSEFTDSDIVCYSVTGEMDGGRHMWNVVSIDGTNYLADITNSDAGMIGAGGGLFITNEPVSYSEDHRTHTFYAGNDNNVYTYDEDQKDLYCDGYLAILASKPDQELKFADESIGAHPTLEHTYGDTFTPPVIKNETINGGDITYTSSNTDVAEVNETTGAVTIKKVGTVIITATAAETDDYSETTKNYEIDVEPRDIDIDTAKTTVSKAYDGTIDAAAGDVKVKFNDDIANAELKETDYNVIKAEFRDKNVGEGKAVDVKVRLNRESEKAKNFNFVSDSNTITIYTGKIMPKALTADDLEFVISGGSNSKVYDGTTSANANLSVGVKSTVLASGDNITISGTFAYDDKNVGTDKVITFTPEADPLGGTDADNYSLSDFTSLEYNGGVITPYTVNATRADDKAITKSYNGTNAAANIAFNFNGIAGDGEITVTTTGNTYSDKNAGENKAITVGTGSSENTDFSNYTVNYGAVTGSITPKVITAAVSGPDEVTYGKEYAHTAAVVDKTEIIDGDSVDFGVEYYSGDNKLSAKPTDAASYFVRPVSNNSNYVCSASSYAFEIKAAVPEINKNIVVNLRYNNTASQSFDLSDLGENLPAGRIKVASVTDENNILSEKPTIGAELTSYSLKSGLNESAAEKSAVIGFTFIPESANYESVSGSLTIKVINKEPIEGIKLSISSITYGESLADPIYSTPIKDVDGKWDISYTGTLADSTYYDSDVKPEEPGEYTVIATYEGVNLKGTKTVDFTISKKQLSYTSISAADKVYDGNTNVTINGTLGLVGVVDGDTVSVNGTPAYAFDDKNAGNNKEIKINGINVIAAITGADAWKYIAPAEIPALTANITPKPVTAAVTSGAITKIYDGSTGISDEIIFSFDNVEGVSNDITASQNKFADKDVGTGKEIIVGTKSYDNDDIKNYDINYPAVYGTITPAKLTVTISGPADAVYGDKFTHTAVITSGLVGTDMAEIAIAYKSGETAIDGVPVNAGSYTIFGSTEHKNYTVGTTTGVTSFTITKATPVINTQVLKYLRYNTLSSQSLVVADLGTNLPDGKIYVVSVANENTILATVPAAGEELTAYSIKDGLTTDAVGKTAEINFKFTPDDSGNYTDATGKLIITITDKEIINDIKVTMNGGVYGDELAEPIATTAAIGGTFSYVYSGTLKDNSSYTDTDVIPTLPGKYTVTAIYESDTHKGSGSAAFEITQKPLAYTGLKVKDKTYNGMTDAEVEGTLAYDGVINNDELDAPEAITNAKFDFADAEIGNDIVVNITDYSNILSGNDAWKYLAPTEFVLKGNITKPTGSVVVGNPNKKLEQKETEDEIETAYQQLRDDLGGLYADVAAMKSAMLQEAKQVIPTIGSNIKFFDLTLTDNSDNSGGSDIGISSGPFTIFIPYPDGTNSSYIFTVVHMLHDGVLERPDVTRKPYGIEFNVYSTSPFAIAWRAASTGSGSSGGGGGGSSFDDEQSDFWSTVREKIENANSGDTVKVYAEYFDKMSWKVMQALRNNSGVTLVIDWNNGKPITIPAGAALSDQAGRVYYPLSYLAEKYKNAPEATAVLTPAYNPTTGGKTISIAAPAPSLIDSPAPVSILPTPAEDGINKQQAIIESTPIVPVEKAPIVAEDVIDVITLADDSSSNNIMGIAALAIAVAAFILGGVAYIKNRGRKNRI